MWQNQVGPKVEANLTKSRSPHSQRQGQQHQLNQRERTIKKGEDQTEERDQKKQKEEARSTTTKENTNREKGRDRKRGYEDEPPPPQKKRRRAQTSPSLQSQEWTCKKPTAQFPQIHKRHRSQSPLGRRIKTGWSSQLQGNARKPLLQAAWGHRATTHIRKDKCGKGPK